MISIFQKYAQVFQKAQPYSLYVLFLMLFTYMLNQLDRYTLSITSIDVAQSLKYGDKACMLQKNQSKAFSNNCKSLNESACDAHVLNGTKEHICKYDYNGQGLEYQVWDFLPSFH